MNVHISNELLGALVRHALEKADRSELLDLRTGEIHKFPPRVIVEECREMQGEGWWLNVTCSTEITR